MKTFLAVIVGYAVWTVCWLGGNACFRAMDLTPKDQTVRIESPGPLLLLLALSVVASIVSGFLAGLTSPAKAAHYVCAALLLATGCAVQWSARALFPVWYHIAFLLLVVPVFLVGTRLGARS